MTLSYPFPWDLFLDLAHDLPFGYRSTVADARAMLAKMKPQPVVQGQDRIPEHGPVVLAANHYQRRGLWIGWSSAVITVAVAERRGMEPPIHWLVTGGLRLLQGQQRGPIIPLSGLLFRRVADIYQMTALPLKPGMPRAMALRKWLHWTEVDGALGVFPEGLAGRSDGLRGAEPGFTALCRALSRRQIPIVPVGVFEQKGLLHVSFGDPVTLGPDDTGDGVMSAIAALLPAGMRGPYAASRRRDLVTERD